MNRLKFLPVILFVAAVLYFFKPFLFENKLPVPSDTIVGLYHPFRDLYSEEYPNGIPFKNFLVTDPVRQQYPWRELAIAIEKKFELPLWNPYNFSGTPLLANMQSAALYPLNVVFLIFSFNLAWSTLIILGLFLGGLFLYFYLDNLKLNRWASLIGAISFSFSGFFVAWLEWGTILHVALWLPLVLLSIDKIFLFLHSHKFSIFNFSRKAGSRSARQFSILKWSFVFVFSLTSSFLAGHLQIFFYLFMFSTVYLIVRWIQRGKIFNILFVFFISYILFFILTAVQWLPTLQFIMHSARDIDQGSWQQVGWFVPWQHLIQFVAPDFFGNPTTLNYWGVWNYGEFVGYIGIFPFLMAIFALFFRHDKKTLFFGTIFFISLLFSLPTIFSKLPYILNLPFLSTAQPTRLLFLTDFSLAVLATFGFDYFMRIKTKKILYPLGFIAFVFLILWAFVIFGNEITKIVFKENMLVSQRNLIFPTLVFIISAILLFGVTRFLKLGKKYAIMIYIIIVVLIAIDLIRFGWKFTPFVTQEYLFPKTRTIEFLQKNLGNARIMATDSRILPPNFSIVFRLQSVDGYDPLYLRRYGELIAASERGEPNISPPFGFNRIITPQKFDSKIIDLLGVKYILSLSDMDSTKLEKVFEEGETRVYENRNALPRVFFVEEVEFINDKNEIIERMFEENFDPRKTAIIETFSRISLGANVNSPRAAGIAFGDARLGCTRCDAKIVYYGGNELTIETENDEEGFLVLTDSYYPSWKAKIDGRQTSIFRTNYNFRGVVVPSGKHTVVFYIELL